MPAAKQVHPAKFPKFRVLYEDRYFTVAWGMYDKEPPERLAMRWNGGPNEAGYPRRGKYPVWFMLPKQLSAPLVKALLGIKSAKNQAILEVLKQLHPTAHQH
jgi:type VI protein secretion system component VasF